MKIFVVRNNRGEDIMSFFEFADACDWIFSDGAIWAWNRAEILSICHETIPWDQAPIAA